MNAIRTRANAIRGRVDFVDKTVYYAVFDHDGKILASDNTGAQAWERMLASCLADVAAFRRVALIGHTFSRSYPEIVNSDGEGIGA